MTKRTLPYSPEVRSRAVRMLLAHQGEHASQWAAIHSIAAKIGCSGETLRNWIRQSERDKGLRGGPEHGRARVDQGAGSFESLGMRAICRVLPIAPSTYRAHVARRIDPSRRPARARSDAALMVEIQRVFEANFHVDGVRKVWRQLGREGVVVARCTVPRRMRAMGRKGVVRGKAVRTTIPDPAAICPLDRVNRQFQAPRPNAVWVSDFTYLATWAGFVYAAFVIDVLARRNVGWRVSRTAHAAFVLDA